MRDLAELREWASSYAEAWCSQNPEEVASFFAEDASLQVNADPPAVGRVAIAGTARGFMRDFPDMVVRFDKLEPRGDRTAFHWTLTGTHADTGNHVRISGYELWKIDPDGLIAESQGHFDSADYERQLKGSDEL
jgi:nuclear transport factor 2 (NTF2) superfamily protein